MFFDPDALKGSLQNPVIPLDLPWTCPVDGTYWFNHRGPYDTHPVRPSKEWFCEAGQVVTAMTPSGTPL